MQIDHSEDRGSCQHSTCRCSVPSGQEFCCESCRKAAHDEASSANAPDTCPCGHSECAQYK